MLKCSPTDSLDTIKKAHRKLASEYHPDKIQSKDLPEAFIIFANEKFKEINHAHEMIVKFRKEEKFNQTLRKFFV
nr:DnaJ domain-containing protein [Helicobacter pylori]